MSRFSNIRSGDDGHQAAPTLPAAEGPPQVRPRHPAESTPSRPSRGRRLREPLPLIGIALVLLALFGYLAVYSASTQRSSVLITTRSLAPGEALTAPDFRTAQLGGSVSVIGGLVPASELQQVLGQRLSSGLPAGAPLPRSALAGQAAGSSAMTLAVPEVHALGGALQPGDTVTVLATFGAGTGNARTRPVARGLQVLAVGSPPPDADPASATIPVTVALPNASVASELALAGEDGKLDLVREGAGGQTAAIPPASDNGGAP